MPGSPVQVDVLSPPRFDRSLLLVRVLIAIALGWIGITSGLVVGLLYLLLPAAAAIAISSRSDRFPPELGPHIWRPLVWLLQLWAFMSLLVDRFPTERDHPVRIHIQLTGTPTVGSALARLVSSLPSAFVLALLWFVSGPLWVVAAIAILLTGGAPDWFLAYQRGVLRWNARLVAYHASLVAEYPPFDFETGDHHPDSMAASTAP